MEILLNYDVQTLFKALVLTVIVLFCVLDVIKRIKEVLRVYYNSKHGKEQTQDKIESLQKNDADQNEILSSLMKSLGVISYAVRTQMRHSIVRIAEEALKVGKIGSYELKSLEELYECYGDPNGLKGNSYVHDLMDKVRELPVDYTNGDPERR